MRRWLITLVLGAAALGFQADVRQVVDLDAITLAIKIDDYQRDYTGDRAGKHYQMLWSHTTPPADGIPREADNLDSAPTDQLEKASALWQDAKISTSTPYRMRVDVYDGPSGRGYVVVYQVQVGRQLWERAINHGPDESFSHDWQQVIEE